MTESDGLYQAVKGVTLGSTSKHLGLSDGLAEKLDHLSDAEWDELTSWMIARFKREMHIRGLAIVKESYVRE